MSEPASLLVCSETDGGVPVHTQALSRGLAARGRRVLVAASPGFNAGEPPGIGIDVAPIPITGAMIAPGTDARSVWAVVRLIRREHIGVVHGIGQKGGVVARVAGLLTATPTIYSPHGFGYRTQLLRQRRWARQRRWVVLGIERLLGRTTDLLVASCEEERKAAVDDRVIAASRLIVVHYGVCPDRAVTPDRGLRAFSSAEPLVGFVTGLREQKGLPLLFDALDLLHRQGRVPKVAIVGNGPLAPFVAERIANGGLTGRVMRMPYEGSMERYLGAIDVYVHPSYWEALPTAVLDAMAMGLPVIATAVNGTPEAIEHGRTGILVAPNDHRALAAAIVRVVNDAGLRARLGAAARTEAESRFRQSRMLDEYAQVHRLVSSAARRRPWQLAAPIMIEEAEPAGVDYRQSS